MNIMYIFGVRGSSVEEIFLVHYVYYTRCVESGCQKGFASHSVIVCLGPDWFVGLRRSYC